MRPSLVMPVLASALTSSTLAQLSCPSSNGTTYTSSNGASFVIECGIDHAGGDWRMNQTSTFQACVDLCASSSICVDVSYSGVACYQKSSLGAPVSNGVWGARLVGTTSSIVSATSTGKATSISTSTTAVASTTSAPSASTANPSTTSASSASATTPTLTCPGSNSTTYTVSSSAVFVVECMIDRAGGDLSMVYTSSFGACIAACGSTTGCVDVSWVPGTPQGPCYMKSVLDAPQSNAGVWGARMVSRASSTSTLTSKLTTKSSKLTSATTSAATTASTTVQATTTIATPTSSTSLSSASATGSGSTGCGMALPSGLTPGGSSVSMNFTQSDGTNRSYLIHIPSTYSTTSKTPLIFSFHGASNTGAGQEGLTGLSQSSNNPNAIVIYPNGVNGYWQGAPYSTAGIDDVAFVSELLASLSSQYCLDPNRIYASGFSNGGGFVGTLACDPTASKLFAAFAANSGAFYPNVSSTDCNPTAVPLTCNPGRLHQPFIEVHGLADGQIAYNGGVHNGECLPALPYYMTSWSQREGFGSVNSTTSLGNNNTEYQWGSLSGLAGVVTHISVAGLGHTWWSGSATTFVNFFNQWTLAGTS